MKNFKINWIHLSDIHFAFKNHQTNRIRDRLFYILDQKKAEEKIDCVFITGDITDKSRQYTSDLFDFINEIIKILDLDVRNLFIVPGNHDYERSDTRTQIIEDTIKSKNPLNTIEKLSEDKILTLLNSQNKFWEMYNKIKGNCPEKENKIHFIERRAGFNVIHLNTAWLCSDDGSQGVLHIGVDRLGKLLLDAKLSPDEINFVIGHHCLDWISGRERTN